MAFGYYVPCDLRVPGVNSAGNVSVVDVIGNKLDTWQGDSIYAVLAAQYASLHSETLVYPTLAAGAPVVSPAGLWAWGNYAVVVPAGTIAADFHLLAIQVETCSVANGIFQLELYQGAADDLIAALRFAVFGGFFGNARYPIFAEAVTGGSQIRARLASSVGAAAITVSVEYHVFP
jgi:hypothetical protein